MPMIQYFLEVSIAWSGFLLLYAIALRMETYFKWNRCYLLLTTVFGLLVPLADHMLNDMMMMTMQMEPVILISQGTDMIARTIEARTRTWPFESAVYSIYVLGACLVFSRMALGCWKITRLYREGRKETHDGYTLVVLKSRINPFSFLRYIFISEDCVLNKDHHKILHHEMNHVRNHHTIDLIAMEILTCFFWWNPLVYLYKKLIRENHEFEADRIGLGEGTDYKLSEILLYPIYWTEEQPLGHAFFNSHLKNRINMFNKEKSKPVVLLKYLLVIPLIGCMTLLFSGSEPLLESFPSGEIGLFTADTIPPAPLPPPLPPGPEGPQSAPGTPLPPPPPPPPPQVSSASGIGAPSGASDHGEIFKVVEEMPLFPGCENLKGQEAQKCSQEKLIGYISQNLRYPESAKSEKVEGNVLVQFVVGKNGTISHVKLVKDIGAGCGEEAVRVVESMNGMPAPWTPGMQRGQPVAVQLTLPFNFRLPQKDK